VPPPELTAKTRGTRLKLEFQAVATCDQSMAGKTCLVTGATAGIGAVTARVLAERGATVIGVGRNQQKCAALAEQIRAQSKNESVVFLRADLSVQADIRELANQIIERYPRLDVLINNAGAVFFERRLSADGIEMTFALNHLNYFLFTKLLLDKLKASAPARIVNVSSAAHRRAVLDFGDLQNERSFRGFQVYSQSKLANLLFSYELARRLEGTGVTVNALHPGWVATRFGAEAGWKGRLLNRVSAWFAISQEEGADTAVYLATSPEVEGVTGKYFVERRAVPSSSASTDSAAASRLWQISATMTKLPR
jgi:NAD(P)-dependent dehydrogenase (short-subunit alcohol dehydrogenase family)